MTRISKETLDPKVQKQLFSQFSGLLMAKNKKALGEILRSLFTDAEIVMLTKRLAVIYLLIEGYSSYAISKQLLVSDSTVRNLKRQLEVGRFDAMTASLRNKKFNKEEFWKTVDLLLRAGLPPRGKGRWKWLYEGQ
ncbi:MAG: hypothetical protein K9M10_02510 [Candidatus Pacebacteria bacterium]|nr:hypothetical protein [Candidatus Paceibacterota bacterium]MCF7857328.1 hypothetical protein [Candidatus Paceibacterota bacterium]